MFEKSEVDQSEDIEFKEGRDNSQIFEEGRKVVCLYFFIGFLVNWIYNQIRYIIDSWLIVLGQGNAD